jgi:hypothetical protein
LKPGTGHLGSEGVKAQMCRPGPDLKTADTSRPGRREQMILESISDIIMAFALMSIPIVVLIGALTLSIVKMLGRQRLEELASHERIAAIERGLHPSQLPVARSV